MTARVKLGKKQYRTSESSVGTPVDVKGFKKFPGKPICQVQFGIVPDKVRICSLIKNCKSYETW